MVPGSPKWNHLVKLLKCRFPVPVPDTEFTFLEWRVLGIFIFKKSQSRILGCDIIGPQAERQHVVQAGLEP